MPTSGQEPASETSVSPAVEEGNAVILPPPLLLRTLSKALKNFLQEVTLPSANCRFKDSIVSLWN
jgi:hypothetical protein